MVPVKTRYIFSKINKEVSSFFDYNVILKDYSLLLENNIDRLEEQLMNYTLDTDSELITKIFRPSKTAQNSLNFISTNEEAALKDLVINDDLWDMVRIIYLLLDSKPSSKDTSIKILYTEIMPSFGVSNISNSY